MTNLADYEMITNNDLSQSEEEEVDVESEEVDEEGSDTNNDLKMQEEENILEPKSQPNETA